MSSGQRVTGLDAGIHPTAIVAAAVRLGDGCVVGPYAVLGEDGGSAGDGPLVIGRDGIVRSHTVIYAGTRIGDGFGSGHGVLIRESTTIGHGASVGSHSVVEHHVVVGDGVRLHSNVFVPEFTTLEDECWIGPNVVLTNARYPRGARVKETLQGPRIESGAKVGANATILPAIVIGRNALVGAGSVVTRDVPAGAVVVGNPARVIGDVAGIEDYQTLLAPGAGVRA
jgi:acetyltransferase-like isoleucine patch superfamily enzyme